MEKKNFDDETLSEKNVELFVSGAIKSYFKKGMMLDGMLWRECIALLAKKYGFAEKFEQAVKEGEKHD